MSHQFEVYISKEMAKLHLLLSSIILALCIVLVNSNIGIIRPNIDINSAFAKIQKSSVVEQVAVKANNSVPKPPGAGGLSTFYLYRDFDQSKKTQRPQRHTYYTTIGVGTPEKLFKVSFDTQAPESWLPYEYTDYGRKVNPGGFRCEKSITTTCQKLSKDGAHFNINNYKNTGANYEGSLYQDMLSLYLDSFDTKNASHRVSSAFQFFGVKKFNNESSLIKRDTYDGVISLNMNLNQLSRLDAFLTIFLPNKLIPVQQQKLFVTLWYNEDLYSRKGAKISIGSDPDYSKISRGGIYYFPINSQSSTSLELNFITLGDNSFKADFFCNYGCSAIIDSGVDSLYVPRHEIGTLAKRFSARRNDKNAYIVDCRYSQDTSDNFALTFLTANIPVKLYAHHFVREAISSEKKEKYCYLNIVESNSNDWILGTSFLTAYTTVFDVANRRIGFASRQGGW